MLFPLFVTHLLLVISRGDDRTTPGLQSIVMGRCYQYQEYSSVNHLRGFSVSINCTKVWEKFHSSFAYKDICDISDKDYDGLFALLKKTKEKSNKVK